MARIINPILKGFNPDPSIIRTGEDYYIATSTFEWFPGVQIHHSKDLVNWSLIGRALTRSTQLDMKGVPDSCGVWAPCLSHHDGIFYLVYSNVKSFQGVWKDTPNYLVTTNDIRGEWSEPTFISATGFDGSLFHDEDGRKWYTSIQLDHRNIKFFGGIVLQEFDPRSQKLIGSPKLIFEGTSLGKTEGPHLYKKDGYYYLITAEGGTEYGHAVTMARSKNIEGPYEVHPDNPLVTCRDDPDWPLQKTGHADIVQTHEGEWMITFLAGRPLTKLGRCTLGRETVVEQLNWKDGEWPSLCSGNKKPRLNIPISDNPQSTAQNILRDNFDSEELDINWQSLRVPVDPSWISIDSNRNVLVLKGRESLSSTHSQSLIARRVQSFKIEATTKLEFSPTSFQQMAGMVFYYNTKHFHYIYMSRSSGGSNNVLRIASCDNDLFSEPLGEEINIGSGTEVFLRGIFFEDIIQFFYSFDGENWTKAGSELDGSILSDDYIREGGNSYLPAFTGAFVGLCCQDLLGNSRSANFHFFEYKELENEDCN